MPRDDSVCFPVFIFCTLSCEECTKTTLPYLFFSQRINQEKKNFFFLNFCLLRAERTNGQIDEPGNVAHNGGAVKRLTQLLDKFETVRPNGIVDRRRDIGADARDSVACDGSLQAVAAKALLAREAVKPRDLDATKRQALAEVVDRKVVDVAHACERARARVCRGFLLSALRHAGRDDFFLLAYRCAAS